MNLKTEINNAPPKNDIKLINIDEVDYTYTITRTEKENEICIKLTEFIQKDNIYFLYKVSLNQIVKDIKTLFKFQNIDKIIYYLKDIFLKSDIKVEKKKEKFIMKIEVLESGILSKYEIELEKHEEIINHKIYREEINKKIKEIDNKYKEIKEEI